MAEFYVYRLHDGVTTFYVGKGSGNRLQAQRSRYRLDGEIIERCRSDDHAFERERHWIAALRPQLNISGGGNGGRVKPKPKTKEERLAEREWKQFEREYNDLGPRRYVARFLLSKLDERNCAAFDLSEVDISRLREVADGPRC